MWNFFPTFFHHRYQTDAAIIATNRAVSDWRIILGDTSTAAAILYRFLENSITFNYKDAKKCQTRW
ncbi:MAG: ATP-binding protein [Crenarchaeota archaeon]|nr:ATP-binding protein [Thermoproteota archaeon]